MIYYILDIKYIIHIIYHIYYTSVLLCIDMHMLSGWIWSRVGSDRVDVLIVDFESQFISQFLSQFRPLVFSGRARKPDTAYLTLSRDSRSDRTVWLVAKFESLRIYMHRVKWIWSYSRAGRKVWITNSITYYKVNHDLGVKWIWSSLITNSVRI